MGIEKTDGGEPVVSYLEFLKSKIRLEPESGFSVDISELSPALKPHQKASVVWALKEFEEKDETISLFGLVEGMA